MSNEDYDFLKDSIVSGHLIGSQDYCQVHGNTYMYLEENEEGEGLACPFCLPLSKKEIASFLFEKAQKQVAEAEKVFKFLNERF